LARNNRLIIFALSEALCVLFNELAVDAEAGLGARLYFVVLGLNLIPGEPLARFPQEQAYIQSWLKALKNDNKMIVWAAKKLF